MAIVKGYLDGELVFNENCSMAQRDFNISLAFTSFGSIGECDKIEVIVIDDDGQKWSPI